MLNETPALAPDGQPYRLLTLRNNAGMVVTLMDWGATLLSAVFRFPMAASARRCSAVPARNAIRIRLRFWGPLLVVMPTASPIAVIPLTVKP
ncbi:aldose 1-epimerase (mutarotase) [Escherichia coli]|uniref:Aldose 1-epimerase (Mutarotase) n=1 Tax=Escherichia coli TaxID=562 RepID=A0A376ZPH4_ECOLX|nr:aldose 1-epimerase (mutarotase) [Escherichia coli]